jgi:hypothetical protein
MTPDEIVFHVPTISLGDVHAALAYYFDHVEEIQEEMRAERALAEEFRRNHHSLLESKLRRSILTGAHSFSSGRAYFLCRRSRPSASGCRRDLAFAAASGRILVTQDVDFLRPQPRQSV